jgi:hypothetical protein
MPLEYGTSERPGAYGSKVGRVVVIAVVAVAFGSVWAMAAGGTRAAVRTVPCDQVIDHPTFPYRSDGYRLVLGAFSVPPAYLRQVVHVGGKWPYWRKTGLVIRADAPAATVTVPRAWRRRAAIIWGNAGNPAGSLRFASCAGRAREGKAYSGGFYLRARSACVPLVFRVGSRTATVRFGVGRRC